MPGPVANTTIEARIERSILAAIRKVGVAFGYMVDEPTIISGISDPLQQQVVIEQQTQLIVNQNGFCIDIFNVGGSRAKGVKKVPRIAFISRRYLSGDIGNLFGPYYQLNPDLPDQIDKVQGDLQTKSYHLDINLVADTADQIRALNRIISTAIGEKRFIQFYDALTDPNALFLVKQYNYYDLPDSLDGITEQVYSYEIPDVYMGEDNTIGSDIAKIKEITLDITTKATTSNMNPIGPIEAGDKEEELKIT